VFGIEVVAEDQLAAEHTAGTFTGDHLAAGARSLSFDRDHIALDVKIDAGRVYARQIELDVEGLCFPLGVHRDYEGRAVVLPPGAD
jgi:hypothetical protein